MNGSTLTFHDHRAVRQASGPDRAGGLYLQRMLRGRPERAGQSGFGPLTSGRDALLALHDLAAASERTLDLQYYIWRKDDAGRLLMSVLLDAADRGVRVRILLDGWEPSWTADEMAALSAHPGLEIRLFNPTLSRHASVIDLLRNPARITHRMHNKAFVADGTVAVVGGRNVSDRYFGIRAGSNYRDLDLLAAGPVVAQIAASFDMFWRSEWSVAPGPTPPARGGCRHVDLEAMRAAVRPRLEAAGDLPVDPAPAAPRDRFAARLSDLVWADAAYLAVDPPSKAETSEPTLLREVRRKLAGQLDSELLVETAYLIPHGSGLDALCRIAGSGVRVRILTNSLQSSDAATTHAGYQRVRRRLLRSGVELYELRGPGGLAPGDRRVLGKDAAAKLHSKAAVVDGRYVLVGSFNADPRSARLNTEIALLIDSPALAGDVAGFIDDGMAACRAYRLALEGGRLVWRAAGDAGELVLRREPGWTLWRGLWLALLSLLPIRQL